MKLYDIIYADPPWRYEFSSDHKDNIENKYPTMELEDIANLKVPTADNCLLYMWTTAPKLEEALYVINKWGFKYRTNMVWDKDWIGMGYWFRIQHEHLLVGMKGNFPSPERTKRIASVFRQQRKEHSRKPVRIRELINEWYPDKTKLEMFARKENTLFEFPDWKGWDVFGNENPDSITLSN